MRIMELYPKGSRYKYKQYGRSDGIGKPNLLNQVFSTDTKNKIWLGDITYIPTKKQRLYLAVFVDLFSRKVVGWAMDTRMRDSLVVDAFNQAYGKEHPGQGLIVHTDQGAQFTGANFRILLKARGAIQSNSRKGNPYDNAIMESFYKTLKRELVQDAHFENPEQAKKEIFKYIELYYNTKRMHTALNYKSPLEFELENS